MELWIILKDIVILLAASLLLGGLFSRFGQSPIVGYLVAGMLLGGPGSIQVVRSASEIEAIAELGVALLLFSLGLEFSLARLRQLGVKPFTGGLLQLVLTILLGAGCAMLCKYGLTESIAFGVMIALSSTAVVLHMLTDRAELEMPHGRNSLAVLLTQDMAVVPLALLMALLSGEGGSSEAIGRVGRMLVLTLALILGLYLLNKIAIRALGTLTLLRNRELTVLFAVVTGLGSAWAAHAVGISPALGAFIAGMLLGSSVFATQIRADISSLRVVLLTLFFGAAGMVADPIWIVQHWYVVAGVTVCLTVGKLAIIWAIFQGLGHTARVASATGLCLAQVGEFAFVLGSIGRLNGAVSAELYALIVSVTIVSFVLSAVLVPLAPRFGSYVSSLLGIRSSRADDPASPQLAPDVVIIGFGPAGQIAARPFIESSQRIVVIDLNRDGITRAQQMGFVGQLGDATQQDVLDHARLGQAGAVVITVPDHRAATTILQHVRRSAPHVHVVVRSRYQIHSADFTSAGAHEVVDDEAEVGESLASHLQQWLDTRRAATPDASELNAD